MKKRSSGSTREGGSEDGLVGVLEVKGKSQSRRKEILRSKRKFVRNRKFETRG